MTPICIDIIVAGCQECTVATLINGKKYILNYMFAPNLLFYTVPLSF
jgi:hypothetical protein